MTRAARAGTSQRSIGDRRLSAQQISRHDFASPAQLVECLGAVQAQDYGAAKWAVGLRLGDAAAEDDIERAVASGAILRIHALRGTWQLVVPADVRWMSSLIAARVDARPTTRHRQLDLDAATFRRSHRALERALRDGDHLTRDELAAVLDEAGVSTEGQRFIHLLARAEHDGLICGGARRGKQPTYVLLDRWAPRGKALSRDEALAELALRYFRSRGPATLRDFTWWSGLAAADARAGLEAVASQLDAEVIAGRRYFRGAAARSASADAPAAHLLPAFDEYLVAYRDRDAVLDPEKVTSLNDGGGMLSPCVVLDGRVVGTWRRTLSRTGVTVSLELFQRPARPQLDAIHAAAQRYGAFLGLQTTVERPSRTK